MKSARLLLLLACLLVAMTATAAAYEPTNGTALGSIIIETKINAKEEVVSLLSLADERSTIPVVPIPAKDKANTYIFGFDMVFSLYDKDEMLGRVNRVNSRFT
ncbi:MAG: hypothetical protein KKB59_14245 [Spirochaetes bacterium]|nr:hypothetical protein [Spirochaetota bacterium]